MKVKVIEHNSYGSNVGALEEEVAEFVNQEGVTVQDIKFSHVDIPESDRMHESTSYAVMIIYKEDRL